MLMDPVLYIIGGFNIHVYFESYQNNMALKMYIALLDYLERYNIKPTYSNFCETVYDPHILPCFTVNIMGIDPKYDTVQCGGPIKAMSQIGFIISWLALNRNGLRVFIHPNTFNRKGEYDNKVLDFSKRGIWLTDYHNNYKTISLDLVSKL